MKMLSAIVFTHKTTDNKPGIKTIIKDITTVECYPGDMTIEIRTPDKIHNFKCHDEEMYHGFVNTIEDGITRSKTYWIDATVDFEEDFDDTFGRFYNVVVGYSGMVADE